MEALLSGLTVRERVDPGHLRSVARPQAYHAKEVPVRPDEVVAEGGYSVVPFCFVQYDIPHTEVLKVRACKTRSGELVSGVGSNFEDINIRATRSEFATVCLFYGNSTEVLAQALVLGYNLRKTQNDRLDHVMLVVSGTSVHNMRLLSTFYTIIKVDPLLPGNKAWNDNLSKTGSKWRQV